MPWITIIMWIVSYFMQTKNGTSKGKAALVATGMAAATYYLADPANKDNVLGVTLGEGKATPGSLVSDGASSNPNGLVTLGSSAVNSLGNVLSSWGPIGTVGAAAGLSGLLGGSSKTWLLVGGIALAGLLLLN